MAVKRFDLGSSGIDFVRTAISTTAEPWSSTSFNPRVKRDYPGNSLAGYLQSIHLESGVSYAFLPEEIAAEQALDYDRHFSGFGAWEPTAAMMDLTSTYLSSEAGGLALFIAAYVRPEDPWLADHAGEFVRNDHDVYFPVSSPAGGEALKRARGAAHGLYPPPLAILATCPDFSSDANGTISNERLEEVSRSADHILVHAYDGTAYVYWSRRECLTDLEVLAYPDEKPGPGKPPSRETLEFFKSVVQSDSDPPPGVRRIGPIKS